MFKSKKSLFTYNIVFRLNEKGDKKEKEELGRTKVLATGAKEAIVSFEKMMVKDKLTKKYKNTVLDCTLVAEKVELNTKNKKDEIQK